MAIQVKNERIQAMNAQRFRDIRQKAGMTQAQVAEALGCNARTIINAESGRHVVKRPLAIALAALHHHRCRQARIKAEDAEYEALNILRLTIIDDGGSHDA